MPSTAISHFSYHPEKQVLAITFVSGNLYHYMGVPEKVYHDLSRSASRGKYFNNYIKNHFDFKHIV